MADTGSHRVLCVDATGGVTTVASGFNYPSGGAVDRTGVVYVTDTGNRVLKKINPPTIGLLPATAAKPAGPTGQRP